MYLKTKNNKNPNTNPMQEAEQKQFERNYSPLLPNHDTLRKRL